MRPIIIPFDEQARAWIGQLWTARFVGRLARYLQPFMVQVPEPIFKNLKSAGVVSEIGAGRFGGQFWELLSDAVYHEDVGLRWENPTHLKSEDCVI